MSRRDRWVVAAGAVTFVVLAGYAARHLRVSTDLSHFLPDSDDRRLGTISRQLSDSTLTRTMIVSVEARDTDTAVAAARELAQSLRTDPEVLRCQSGPQDGTAEAAYRLLFPHRYQLLFDQPEREWPEQLSESGIARAAADLREQLARPTAVLVKRIAGADPLLAFPRLLRRLEGMNGGDLRTVEGQFVTADGTHAVLFLETKHAPFDGAAQKPLLDHIRRSFDEVNGRHGGGLRLEESGLNRFAVDSERIIRADIERISVVSTVAIVLLLLLLFHSLRVVLLAFVPLGFALVAGTAATLALFGEIQGLTLALGSTLIGVCVDYPLHFLNHHALRPSPSGPRGTLRRILWALSLGALTTLAGFAGLGWTSFPGMRELAVFAGAGILASLGATCFLLPALSVQSPKAVPLHQACAAGMARLLAALSHHPRWLTLLALAAAVVCAVGLPRVRWNDNLGDLNRLNEGLRLEDERVRDRVSRMDQGRLIVAVAPDDARALAINDRVEAELRMAQADGQLAAFSSLHALITSPELQRRNDLAMRSDPPAADRVLSGFASAGFRPQSLASFAAVFDAPGPPPLEMNELLGSPLADIVHPFRTALGSEVGLVTLLRGVSHPEALRARISSLQGAYYFDQGEFLARIYRRYRQRTLQLIAVGLLVMFGFVLLKYRRPKVALAAALPAVLAAAATLATLALLGVTTNLMHLVSLLLVLSAGEDYAVFLLESATDATYLSASAVSIVLCGFAMALGFGLLGLSEMPALRAIGMTTGLGVAWCLLLAPTALLWAPRGTAA